jgi:hypothetical protein
VPITRVSPLSKFERVNNAIQPQAGPRPRTGRRGLDAALARTMSVRLAPKHGDESWRIWRPFQRASL